jgi:spore maturation protein CgeB
VRILLVHPGASWSTADVEAGLRAGLIAHGIDVYVYRLDARIERSRRWLMSAWRRTQKDNQTLEKPTPADVIYHAGIGALEQALRHQVDVVLVVSAMFLHPDVIILMKRAGLRVVSLFTESPYDAERELAVARLVDGLWTNERTSVDAYRAVCPRVGYLPHAWIQGRHTAAPQPGDETLPRHDVVFVGSAFRERVAWLDAVDWRGIDFGLYGNWTGLPSRHPLRAFVRGASPLPNTIAAALARRAKLCLNLYRTSAGWGPTAPEIAHAESLNPRAYELAACGAVTISTPRAEVAERFGGLVHEVRSPVDASSLIRALLADRDERARISRELPATVAEHHWSARARMVIGDLQALLRGVRAA